MKKIITLFSICFYVSFLNGQEILITGSSFISGFGGPIFEFGSIDGDVTVSTGGGGAALFDNFFFGGYGLGASDLDTKVWNGDEYDISYGHGGLWLGYISNRTQLVHWTTSLRLGWGSIEARDIEGDRGTLDDGIFVLTPMAGGEINITHWFRIAGSVGYRWTSGANKLFDYSDTDFSSIMGQLVLKFGWFKEYN